MNYLLENKNFYNNGELVLMKYWYNGMITPVEILEREGRKYRVTHNNEYSEIKNAPEELIMPYEIIDRYKV